jgi:hypothetical protein
LVAENPARGDGSWALIISRSLLGRVCGGVPTYSSDGFVVAFISNDSLASFPPGAIGGERLKTVLCDSEIVLDQAVVSKRASNVLGGAVVVLDDRRVVRYSTGRYIDWVHLVGVLRLFSPSGLDEGLQRRGTE